MSTDWFQKALKVSYNLRRHVTIHVSMDWDFNGVIEAAKTERDLQLSVMYDIIPGYTVTYQGKDVTENDLTWLRDYMYRNGGTVEYTGG